MVLAMAIADCGGSPASPSPSPSLTVSPGPTISPSPTLAPTPTPSPTPAPTLVPTLSPTGTFVATGSMTQPRMDATATLLPDGKVLVAGGSVVPVSQVVASAELYDPSTHKFTRTGSMATARSNAAATLLANGRVLIVGGDGCRNLATCPEPDSLKSAELYDPTTGRFTPTGSMSEARANATAILLPDGRVLVLSGGSLLVEVYDPTTGKFTRAGSLLNQYQDVRALLLPNGKVLVVGDGLPGLGAEVFDPGSGLSSSISVPLPSGAVTADIYVETATLLQDGRVLLQVFDSDSVVNYLITYDSVTGTFTQSASIDAPVGWIPTAAALLRDGRVFFAGGWIADPPHSGEGYTADSAGLYDPASGFHLLSSKMIQARDDLTATALPDGTVLIAGGITDYQKAFSSAELFEP